MPALGGEGLRILTDAVNKLDPNGEYVRLDVAQRSIWYSPDIVTHEFFSSYAGEEEPVRAYLVAWLIKVGGYPAGSIELEKRYPSGRGQVELDIRIADESNRAYALVEVKAPDVYGDATDPLIDGQLYAPASREPGTRVLSLATIELDADGEFVTPRSVTIDYQSWPNYDEWRGAGYPHRDDIPLNYGEATIEPLVRGGSRDLNHSVGQRELDRLRQRLHDRLWGGSNDDNAIYAWLVSVFLTKIHDEKVTDDGEAYTFQVFHNGSRPEAASATANRVNVRWREAYSKYILRDGPDPAPLNNGLFNAGDLAWVVEMLQGLSLTSAGLANGDLLGRFFEAITREGFKQSKGLFFTHYNIAAFMVEVLDVGGLARQFLRDPSRHTNDRLPYVIDPSCGSGTFLLAAMRSVTGQLQRNRESLATNADVREALNRWLPETAPNTWAAEFLYGLEKREDLATSTKVNMVLHQDGHTHIYKDDALAPLDQIAARHSEEKFRTHNEHASGYPRPVAATMDVVITNPPFSLTLDAIILESLSQTFSLSTQRNSENLFLERWYQLLNPGGRLGAVLPESFFSTPENVSARRFLFHHFHVRAIVSLPPHAFQPWTPTRTSLLFAERKTAAEILAWGEAYDTNKQDLELSRRSATTTLNRLRSPRATDDKVIQARVRGELHGHLRILGIDSSPELTTKADLDQVQELLRGIDVEQIAFARTVGTLASDESYCGITVTEIGYRRTKRGETNRRNDLFNAAVTIEGVTTSVRNLNSAASSWCITTTNTDDDALSLLRRANLWH
jgi:type I restriction enzyme M protein